MELNSIAFIPDGNRRYALRNGISLVEAYRLGTQKAWDVFSWLHDYPKVKFGTFWALSTENFKRKAELPVLFKIFEKELERVKTSGLFEKHAVRLKFVGRLSLFPKKIQDKIKKAEEFTQDFKGKTMNVAIGYGGQTEIVDAAKQIATEHAKGNLALQDLNERTFANYLYNPVNTPDLIVRTSGTQRLSGFLQYQSAYSELYFCDKYWPEFSKQDLSLAIEEFNERKRNFGK